MTKDIKGFFIIVGSSLPSDLLTSAVHAFMLACSCNTIVNSIDSVGRFTFQIFSNVVLLYLFIIYNSTTGSYTNVLLRKHFFTAPKYG